VILLVLVAVLWIVVLAPGAFRRFGDRQGGGSIDHFHHELQLLKHAGPKLVSPAHRLHGTGSLYAPDAPASRPQLVLLRPVHDGQSADIDDEDGAHYARVGVIESPEPPISLAQTEAELVAYRRHQARQRCTLVLRVLTAVAIGTGILGVVPSLRPAWIVTALTGIGALALVGLIAYAREVEGQRRVRPRRLTTPYGDERTTFSGSAQAGHPGAWDEEGNEGLRQAAGGR
jgi:hypothetical protein